MLPCILGIVPGETDFTSALQELASIGTQQGIEFKTATEGGTTLFAEVKGTDPRSGRYVSQLLIYALYPNKVTTLGDILNAGYRPVRVFRRRVNGPGGVSLLIVFGEDQTIIADISGYDSVNADSPVRSLTVIAKVDQEWRLGDILMVEHWDYEINWLGFASADAYLSQAPKDLQSFKRAAYQM